MLLPRIIPCLLLKDAGLVKTVRFKDPTYVGDPINAVKIFNDKEVDELIFLDISATVEGRGPNIEMIADIASECFMPMAYGGGITSTSQVKTILNLGVEKVVINSAAAENESLVRAAADLAGSSSVVISIDVKKSLFGKGTVYTKGGRSNSGRDPVSFATRMQELGAGELMINSIDRDGTQNGYDLELIKSVTANVDIPVVACGGAGCLDDIGQAITVGGASAAAAGSFFVFHGKHRAVLINFPTQAQIKELFRSVRGSDLGKSSALG